MTVESGQLVVTVVGMVSYGTEKSFGEPIE